VLLKPALCIVVTLGVALEAAPRQEPANPCVQQPLIELPSTASAGPRSGEMLTIASLNVKQDPRISDALEAWTHQRGIDLLLLQEVGPTVGEGETFVRAMSARLGFHLVYVASYAPQEHIQGLAIMSRYPLGEARVDSLPYHKLRFRSRCRIALTATVTTDAGRVRVADVHLDTRINSKARIAQLAPVLEVMKSADGPQIIGGDFNTVNIGWLDSMWPFPYAQRQPAAVRESMGAAGFATAFGSTRPTFKLFHLPLRLDWLYAKHLDAVEWSVDDVEYSDHRGIWAHFKTSLSQARAPTVERPQ
jgi:endonuclease/exonuclease/phosphatase family metal-dependent hydrolase